MEVEPLLTAREIAAAVRLEPQAVLLLARKGVLPSIRLGYKTVRFRMSEVLAALDKARTGNFTEKITGDIEQ